MPREKPPIVALSDLEPGQFADCFVLLAERKAAMTSAGKPYFLCRFRDHRRTASFMAWSDGGFFEDCEQNWQVGKCYKLRCKYSEHEKYGPQVEVAAIRPATDQDKADGYDPMRFVEQSRRDPDEMLAELRVMVDKEIADQSLKRLVLRILDEHAEKLRWLPGSREKYYPFAGGWLEHTLSVLQSCLHLADKYRAMYPELTPPINRDLLAAGAVLHDVGRLAQFDEPIALQPTVPGELFGHLILARDIVRDAARAMEQEAHCDAAVPAAEESKAAGTAAPQKQDTSEPLNSELLQLLEHLILSHLNLPSWGSVRLPLITESLILHHADDLDAKVEMYVRCLTRDVAAGPFTDKDPVLGRPLLKGRSV
jgi:3'-5' exoribonuclease